MYRGKISLKFIDIQTKIRPCRWEFIFKINKRACTSIRYTRVFRKSSLWGVLVLLTGDKTCLYAENQKICIISLRQKHAYYVLCTAKGIQTIQQLIAVLIHLQYLWQYKAETSMSSVIMGHLGEFQSRPTGKKEKGKKIFLSSSSEMFFSNVSKSQLYIFNSI